MRNKGQNRAAKRMNRVGQVCVAYATQTWRAVRSPAFSVFLSAVSQMRISDFSDFGFLRRRSSVKICFGRASACA